MRQTSRALERGAGSVLAIGLIAAILAVVTVSAAPLVRLLEVHRLQVMADSAVIAAADALRGLVAGSPCDVARQVSSSIYSCEVIGHDVRIELRLGDLVAKSRAGEP